MSFDPATAGIRRPQHHGHGNAEPHDEPAHVWTEADFAEFNAGVMYARLQYDAEQTPTDERRAQRAAQKRRARARKAEK